MITYRFHTDEQFVSNFAVRLPIGNEGEYFAFALRQFWKKLCPGCWLSTGKELHKAGGDFRAE